MITQIAFVTYLEKVFFFLERKFSDNFFENKFDEKNLLKISVKQKVLFIIFIEWTKYSFEFIFNLM